MFILNVLGGATLDGPDGPVGGQPAQKRRLALLTLLAMSRGTRLSRSKLIAYLWPEREETSARRLLSDAVYVLNRALGAEALSGVSDELRLGTERVACDAQAFEAAIDGCNDEEAVRLYTGPFLDGFFLDRSEEFESWVSRERDRLAGLYTAALERIAIARQEAGDIRGAVDAWRRVALEDPYNSAVAVQLARTMERSGDRAGALQSVQTHVAFLREELGLGASAELRDVLLSLQASPPSAPMPSIPPNLPMPDASFIPLAAPDTQTPEPEGMTVAWSQSAPSRARQPALRWGLVTAALATVLLTWWSPWRSPAAPTLQSIAVMPFEHAGQERADRYVGDGIADELTTYLGRASRLRVAARTSAFALRGRQLDAREIGRALGVDTLLEGSVRQESNRLRVSVRLVSTHDGYQIWSETWDRSLDDLLAVQEHIAEQVLRVLEGPAAETGDGRLATASVPSEAYHLYLQGRYLWHQRTRDSLGRAAAAFERATVMAPAFAQAYSGLADAYAVMGFYDYLPPAEAFPRARSAAERALALDPRLAQAHASLGYVALYYDWNWADAEASFGRAISHNPSYSVAHQWYANYLTARGRFDEAVAAMRRAQAVDPLSLIASAALGWVHFYGRDYDAAVEQCQRTLELNPQFELAHLWAGWAEELAGRPAAAVEHLTSAVRLSSGSAVALASLGRAQALAGNRAVAERTLADLHRDHAAYLPAFELAKLYLALDDTEEAMVWLQRAYHERSHSMVFLNVDPQLDALRSDPRFITLAQRVAPVATVIAHVPR